MDKSICFYDDFCCIFVANLLIFLLTTPKKFFMKKIILLFALILTFGLSSYAQSSGTSITDISMKGSAAVAVKIFTVNKVGISLAVIKAKGIMVCEKGLNEGDVISIYNKQKEQVKKIELKTVNIKSGIDISKLKKGMPYLVEIKTKKGIERGEFKY